MTISDKELEQIAYLARIGVDKSSFPGLKEKLSDILEMVNELNKIDTDEVSPMSHPLDISQPLRPDQVTEGDQRAALQKHSPLTKAGLFLVPKVIDKED
ncbi:MAG: Asp-tRNA(Asn)/Glu-tRNA(Gln) amidotransferase subunit GatC [Gammaproteobacteria bacterium]